MNKFTVLFLLTINLIGVLFTGLITLFSFKILFKEICNKVPSLENLLADIILTMFFFSCTIILVKGVLTILNTLGF